MTTLDTQNEIFLFNSQKPIANLQDKDLKQKDFREIVLGAKEEDQEQDLWLKLLDLNPELTNQDSAKGQKNWINLYLGRSQTFEKGKSPKKHNIVVPIIPRCYATPDRDPAKAVEVPEGWLYIIRQFESPQGMVVELWRELKSDGLGNFSDVNLKRFKKKDQRRATGQPGFRIIVPYCIGKKDHQIWMAYSEVQWSWNRVQSLKKSSKLREQRMHKLDLSDCLNDFAESVYKTTSSPKKTGNPQDKLEVKNVSGPALLYNLKSAPDPESQNLAEDFKEAIPVVYLDNPIGIGRNLAGEYQQQWQELTDYLNDLRAMPNLVGNPGLYAPGSAKLAEDNAKRHGVERWFEAAALANRYFFSKISKVIPPGVKDIPAYEKRLTEIDEQFIQYQNMLDKPAIDQALKTSQRREIREKLVQARDNLVEFLEKELAAIQSKESGGETQDPPLVHALDDYFTLTPLGDRERKQNPNNVVGDKSTPRWRDNYLDGWGAVFDLVAYLGKHEYSLDADLEANPPDGWQWRRNNPAFELLRKLADPKGGCPLHSRLFPKAAAGEPLKINAAAVEVIATAFKVQHLDNIELLTRRDADLARGLNLFGSNFNELMAMRDNKDRAYEQTLERARHSILRLVESVFGLQLEESDISLAELIARAKKQAEEDKNGGVTLGAAIIKTVGFMDKAIDEAGKFPETADPGSGALSKIRVKVITVVNKTRTLKLLRDLGDDRAVTSGLAGFLGLVEIHNFTNAIKAHANNQNDDRKWEQFAPLVASFLSLPAAIKDIKGLAAEAAAKAGPKAAGGGQAVAQAGLREGRKALAATKTTGFELLGKFGQKLNLIANLIDLELTLSNFIENLEQNDDAAIADAIGLAGITFGIVATFVSIPGAGWIVGLAVIAHWLAKAYLFSEDAPVEVWLENGPFARGDEYHEVFGYNRSTTIKKVRDAKGNWVDTACTVHRYDNFEFLVDSGGTLVHAGPPPYSSPIQKLRVAPDGTVVLKAGKWYDLRTNKHHEIPADTTVATIGQPFTMHPLLKTSVKEKPQNKNGENKKPAWHHPHQAYLALADAVYRPRVTMTETSTMIGQRRSTVALKVHLPFYIPQKSELYIEFGATGGKTFRDKGEIETISLNPVSDLSLNGPGDFEIVRTVYPGESRTFTANVRLDLFGDGEVQLPHEPLFCGSEIKTQNDEKTVEGVQLKTSTKWIVAKTTVTQEAITHFDRILNPGDSGTRLPGA